MTALTTAPTPSAHRPLGWAPVLIAGYGAGLVLGSRFASSGRTAWAWFSRVTGILFRAAFAGIAGGSHGPTTLAFAAAVVLAWTWPAAVCIHFYRAAA